MIDSRKSQNQPAENQQLSAVLTQMSGAELVQMLDMIEALQVDLLRVVPLFKGKEPVEAVMYTKYLLELLNDDMNRVLKIKQAENIRDTSQIPNLAGVRIDYAPTLRLLSKIQGNKRRLIWAGMNAPE